MLTFDEIHRVASIFARMGVKKIRITGGEPLVRKNVPELIARLAALPGIETIGITTNGVLLADHARELYDAGLKSVNISLDSLRKDGFEQITRRDHLSEVIEGIDAALAVGFRSVKVNVVVMRGVNDNELEDFVAMTKVKPLNVRFIEYMPFRDNGWHMERMISFAEMRDRIATGHTLIPLISRDHSAVARDFMIEGHVGTVSFISSMSEHFCDACNRVRLTADGSIKPCLFSNGETNVRTALRNGTTDAGITEMIRRSLQTKPLAHAPMNELTTLDNRTMIQIGG